MVISRWISFYDRVNMIKRIIINLSSTDAAKVLNVLVNLAAVTFLLRKILPPRWP